MPRFFKELEMGSASVPEDVEKHFRIIDFLLVFSTIASLVKCAQCDGSIEFKSCKKEGLGFQIQVKCTNCDPRFIPSSEKTGHCYEINTRFAFVMRTLGLDLAGCNKFCGLMDIASSFLSKQSYLDLMKSICCSIETTAEKFLVSAADEEKQLTRANSESNTLTVSVKFAFYVAACTFNEGAGALLTFLSDMDVSVGPSAHEYASSTDSNHIDRAEFQAVQQSKEARIKRRLEKKTG
ncbi:uncharacterized protein LOC123264657 [Cotesia glomerata]|uniref:uncharacterized protein LOC123264657 n=1 Tax=Cotesia glomerata TaxID=32391 RepID=UPI001D032B3E|nr:uncharacterized protein LOC123264657 [Cotesia glomerata]